MDDRSLGAKIARESRDHTFTVMKLGPFLSEEGLVMIPSMSGYMNKDASKFWRQQGFDCRRSGADAYWVRDPQVPAKNGKRYSAVAWLESARNWYYNRFFPQFRVYRQESERHGKQLASVSGQQPDRTPSAVGVPA